MNIKATQVEAKQIHIKVKENYNDALTAIFNNCRESRKILTVSNNCYNDIYITVTKESEEVATEWAAQYGKVIEVCDVLAAVIDENTLPDYNMDKYDDFVIAIV